MDTFRWSGFKSKTRTFLKRQRSRADRRFMNRQSHAEIMEAINIQALEDQETQDYFLPSETEDYLVSAQAVVDMPRYYELEALHTLKKRADRRMTSIEELRLAVKVALMDAILDDILKKVGCKLF